MIQAIDALLMWGLNHMALLERICLGCAAGTALLAAVKILSRKKRSAAWAGRTEH